MLYRPSLFRPRLPLLFVHAFLLAAGIGIPYGSSAQDAWSLQQCISYAGANNLTLQQAQNSVTLARLNEQLNKRSRLPNLSGSAAGGSQFGRTIDPTTNSFDNQRINFNNLSVNMSVPLYSGGQINNSIQQSALDLKAAQEDVAATYNNIALSIANAYLQVLMSKEQLENALSRRRLSAQQLEQTDKLIETGSIPANDRLDVLAQIANDDQTIIQARNQIDISLLNLKLLMQLDPESEFDVAPPPADISSGIDPESLGFSELYTTALNNQPQIKANEYRMGSAALGVEIAKGSLYPNLVLFGGVDSRWSSAARSIDKILPTLISQNIIWNGLEQEILIPSQEVTFKQDPYFNQLRENFGQSLGLSLRVPIYNNSLNRINVQRATVGVQNARINSDLTKQQLKNDIQQALANARAGQRAWEAASTAVQAASAAYENADKRFRLGAINNLQLLTARNTYDIARINLTISKYDYLFRLKILDFYQGKEIRLD
ncbi:MAG: hypothetical protein RLY31_84 [Bacteroidota bacterium]|jgi:outer membrane protein